MPMDALKAFHPAYYPIVGSNQVVVTLHMMRFVMVTWDNLMKVLRSYGAVNAVGCMQSKNKSILSQQEVKAEMPKLSHGQTL